VTAGKDGAQDRLAALATHIGQDVGEPAFSSNGSAFGGPLKFSHDG